MKKFILAVALASMTLVGCAQGPQRGYYDEDGNYHASQSAVNADRAETAGKVAAGVAVAGALAVGIAALHKANKHHDHNDNNNDNHRHDEYRYNQSRGYGGYNHPVQYHQHRRGW